MPQPPVIIRRAPRLLITLVALLHVAPAAAQSAAAVCGKIAFAEAKIACLEATRRGVIQNGAAEVCGTIAFAEDKVACLRNAVGRVYTADELATCRSIAFADAKVACIARAGRVANGPPNYPAPRVHQPPYLPPPPPAEHHRPMPPQPAQPPVTGRYDSTFGHVELFFQGNALRGEYPKGELACQQRRRRLECNWRETNGLAGTATFTVFDSGDMSGQWRTHDNRQNGNWQLRRRH